MRREIDAGLLRDVGEAAVTVVLEQHVAATNGGDHQILIAVVVEIAKGRRHADAIGERDAGLFRDVGEPSAAEILPELVAADLVDEVDVVEAVAVHVGNGEAGAVVVVRHPIVRDLVVDRAMDERDAALGDTVRELEVVEHVKLLRGFELGLTARGERVDADVRGRIALLSRRLIGRGQQSGNRQGCDLCGVQGDAHAGRSS
jgi:hypothetical protein